MFFPLKKRTVSISLECIIIFKRKNDNILQKLGTGETNFQLELYRCWGGTSLHFCLLLSVVFLFVIVESSF